MITYNHEKFIGEAIEGVLIQEVDFEVELVIADDCSTDQTGEIIRNYIEMHPKGRWIKYHRHIENKGMMPNFIWALEQCRGEYIALCEGDDLWTEKRKLKFQVEFLSNNINYNACFHNVSILENGIIKDDFITKKKISKPTNSYWDLLLYGNNIHTCSYMFRMNDLIVPSFFYDLSVGDYFLYLELAKKNNLTKRMDFNGALYRFGVGSFSSSGSSEMRKKFKKSLLIASRNEENIVKKIFLNFKFNQENLYSINRVSKNEIDSLGSFIISLSFIQIIKSIFKMIFRIEHGRCRCF